jgi:uncharacterized damage-inducible protein DinB
MNCIEGNRHLLEQIIRLLEELDDQQYVQPLDCFHGANLGQHFRHILDFYTCLLAGSDTGFLDYTCRERSPLVESHTVFAMGRFQEVHTQLTSLSVDQPVSVQADFSSNPSDLRPQVSSSVGRELMFAYDHSIHHLAIVKMGIQLNFPDVSIPDAVGVAPSTIKHQNTRVTS